MRSQVKAQTGNSMMVMAEMPTEAVDMGMTMGEVRHSEVRRKRSYLLDGFSEVSLKCERFTIELKSYASITALF